MIQPTVDALTALDVPAFVRMIALTASIYVVGVLAALGYTQVMVHAAQKVLVDIRRDLFAHIQTLPLSYFDARNRGDVMSYFTNDVDTVAEAMNNSFAMLIQSFIQIVGTLTLIFVLNWRLSLIVVVGYAAMFGYIAFSTKKSRGYYRRQQEVLGELDGYIEEMVGGQKVVKVFNHEEPNVMAFRDKNERLRVAGTGAQAYAASMIPAVVSISYVNYAIVAVVGSLMAISGLTGVGALASYLVFVRQTAMPINQFTQQSNFLLSALAGAERVFAAMDEPAEIDEGTVELVRTGEDSWAWRIPEGFGVGAWGSLVPVAEDADAPAPGPAAPAEAMGAVVGSTARGADGTVLAVGLVPLRGDVRFHDVSFGVHPGPRGAARAQPLRRARPEDRLRGLHGRGKTTITNLINRFYDIADGKIRYDGININKIKKDDLRRSLGMVLQDVNLFTGTVMDNIRYGRLDATDEECIAAAKLAGAHGFIERLPEGYQTMLTDNGSNLSQGQRQLLSISRAAVADPPVMILDEATSSIDTRTEAIVQKGMDALMNGRTTFVIAHRLSTVRNSDAIIVLDHGRIIERGSHDELIAKRGVYYQLYTGAFELE